MMGKYEDKDDKFKLEYGKFRELLHKDIRSNQEFCGYTNGFSATFINKDAILNFKLDRDIEPTVIGVLYQDERHTPPGLWTEILYSGDIKKDILSLIEMGLFGLFYFKYKCGCYEFFSVGYKIPNYYSLAPSSVLEKPILEELEYIITILNTEGLDITRVDRNYIIKNLTIDLSDIKVDQ